MIVKCFKKWKDLKSLHVHFSDTKLSDAQINKIIYDGISGMKNFQKIHIEIENSGISLNQKKDIENLLKNLPKIKSVKLNFRRNNFTKDDISTIRNMIKNYPNYQLLWELKMKEINFKELKFSINMS